MNATMEAQVIEAYERASVRAVRTIRHQRLAEVTRRLAAPKVCRGCGEETPARELVNVKRDLYPRWLCRSCAEAGR